MRDTLLATALKLAALLVAAAVATGTTWEAAVATAAAATVVVAQIESATAAEDVDTLLGTTLIILQLQVWNVSNHRTETAPQAAPALVAGSDAVGVVAKVVVVRLAMSVITLSTRLRKLTYLSLVAALVICPGSFAVSYFMAPLLTVTGTAHKGAPKNATYVFSKSFSTNV